MPVNPQPSEDMKTNQPQQSKTKRVSDTAIFVGLLCEVCGERIKLSDNAAVWRSYPETLGWHWACFLGAA